MPKHLRDGIQGIASGRLLASQNWIIAEPTLAVLEGGSPGLPVSGGCGVGSVALHSAVRCLLAARASLQHAPRGVRVVQQEVGGLVRVACGAAGRA